MGGKGANNTKLPGWKGGKLSKDQVEQVVANLLVEGYIVEDMHYTPYSIISYLIPGHRTIKQLSVKFLDSRIEQKILRPESSKQEKAKKPKPKKRKIESSDSSDE